MSTGNTTTPSLRSDQLTIIVASFSSVVFFVVVVVLLAIVFRKDPLCCRAQSYQASHGDMEVPPQYYSSRQTLVGSSCLEHTHSMSDNAPPGQLFYVGLPSSYRLPPLDDSLPRLPSYESVRKKDRQRHIHMLIADRFGLNNSAITEPPPTYEESIRQSVEVPYNVEAASHLTPPEDPGMELTSLPDRPVLSPLSWDSQSHTLPV